MPPILVIGPHPDDQEIGMGGAIARLAELGHDVLLLDVTDGSPTPRGDRASRLIEAASALEPLKPTGGKGRLRRVLLDLKNREVEHTIQNRHRFAGVIRAHQAQIVFAPHWEDAHPDHRAVTRIAEDARFDAKLTKVEMPTPPGFTSIGPPIYPKWFFYYDVSHLRGVEKPSFCLDITGYEHRKVQAVRAYRSQFGPWDDSTTPFAKGDPKAATAGPQFGQIVSPDFPDRLLAYARFWGATIGTAAAEPFYTREPLGLSSLDGLIL